MREYAIYAKKLEFGDNRVEKLLDDFGLKIKCMSTSHSEWIIVYEAERQRKLTPKQIEQIEANSLIYEIDAFY